MPPAEQAKPKMRKHVLTSTLDVVPPPLCLCLPPPPPHPHQVVATIGVVPFVLITFLFAYFTWYTGIQYWRLRTKCVSRFLSHCPQHRCSMLTLPHCWSGSFNKLPGHPQPRGRRRPAIRRVRARILRLVPASLFGLFARQPCALGRDCVQDTRLGILRGRSCCRVCDHLVRVDPTQELCVVLH